MSQELPKAQAYLQRGLTFMWVVPDCPYCHQEHRHGGGALSGNPHQLLGPRVAYCKQGNGTQYELVAAPLPGPKYDGAACPWCAGTRMGVGDLEPLGKDKILRPCTCETCQAQWVEVLTVTGYDNLDIPKGS